MQSKLLKIEISNLSQPVFITIVWYCGTIAVLFAVICVYTFEVMCRVLGRDEEEQRIIVIAPWFISKFFEYFVCWAFQVGRPLKRILDCCTEDRKGAWGLNSGERGDDNVEELCQNLQLTDTQLLYLQYRNQTKCFKHFYSRFEEITQSLFGMRFGLGGHYN